MDRTIKVVGNIDYTKQERVMLVEDIDYNTKVIVVAVKEVVVA
jgi:hypothetical protein